MKFGTDVTTNFSEVKVKVQGQNRRILKIFHLLRYL